MADADPSPVIISRKDAKAAGLKFYYTSKPCKYGHVAQRRASNGFCLECELAYHREAMRVARCDEGGRQRLNATRRRWAERLTATPEGRRKFNRMKNDWQRRYYQDPANREERKRKMRERYRANPLRDIERVHRRRMRKRAAGGTFTKEDISRIYLLQRGRCAYCRVNLRGRYQIDHIDPNGSNEPRNLQLTCVSPADPTRPRCNQSKGSRDATEWVREEFGLLL